MACGIPVITTNCLGHKEYLPNIQIQSDLVINNLKTEEAHDNIWFKHQGFWAKVEENDIRDRIRYVLDHQDNYKNLDQNLSRYMHDNYSWTKAALTFTDLLKPYTN
jgi:glycosyltransferase involved in cell wall biosynthesis